MSAPTWNFTKISNAIVDNHIMAYMKPAAFAIYFVLCRRANADGDCYPTIPGLAHDTGISTRSVQKWIHWLNAEGFIKLETTTANSGGDGRYNITINSLPERLMNTSENTLPTADNPANILPAADHITLELPAKIAPKATVTDTSKTGVAGAEFAGGVVQNLRGGWCKNCAPRIKRDSILKRDSYMKNTPIVPINLFDQNDMPKTRQELAIMNQHEFYNAVHLCAGLNEPVTYPKSDMTIVSELLRKQISPERIGAAWKLALAGSDNRFWPFSTVIKKLPILEAQLEKINRYQQQKQASKIPAQNAAPGRPASASGTSSVRDAINQAIQEMQK